MEAFWIDWGLCGELFMRDRQIEFDRREDLTPEKIRKRLTDRREKTIEQVNSLSEEQWLKPREFHKDTHTGLTIILWHVRHIGLHHGHVQAHYRWILNKQPGVEGDSTAATCTIK
jgi:hypothetical protein